VGGSWSPDEVLALNTLIEDRGGRYQICGPNAFNRYGFDDQIPTRVYAYNDRISGERTIGSISLTLIKVPSHYFNGRFIPLPEENFRSDAERGRPGRHRRDRMAVGPLNPMIHFLENVMMAGGLLQIVALARGRSA